MSVCLSCGMPLNVPTDKKIEEYCQYCTDDKGNLLSKEIIQQGIANYLKDITPKKEGVNFMKRAEYFMKAMPAWGEE